MTKKSVLKDINALTDAIRTDDEEKIDVLLKKLTKEDLNTLDREGEAPLHVAVRFSDKDTVKKLLQIGVDVNVRNARAQTPTYLASRHHKMMSRIAIKMLDPIAAYFAIRGNNVLNLLKDAGGKSLNSKKTIYSDKMETTASDTLNKNAQNLTQEQSAMDNGKVMIIKTR